MIKQKIMVIGDYNDSIHIDHLRFLLDCSDQYDIFVSGRNIKCLRDQISETIQRAPLNSDKYLYNLHTAAIVIILDQKVNFIRYKNNQRVIKFITDLDFFTSRRIFYNVTDIVCQKNQITERGLGNELGVNVVEMSGEDWINQTDAIYSMLDLDGTQTILQSDVLVVAENPDQLFDSKFGFGSLLTKVKQLEQYNMVLISKPYYDNRISNVFSSFFNIENNTKSLSSFVSNFKGIVIYESDMAQKKLLEFLHDNEIDFSPESETYIELCNLVPLYADINKGFDSLSCQHPDDYNANHCYRQLLQKAYIENNCSDIKVSVIICFYNTPNELLFRAIKSAISSSHQNVEVIVVNDGSDEDIRELVEQEFEKNSERLKYFYTQNQGVGYARNFGIKQASGEFIYFLDSDDTVQQDGLKLLLAHAVVFDLDLTVGKRIICDELGRPINESLMYLYGDTYCSYNKTTFSKVYDDQMVNNKLIRKETVYKYDIWFPKGLYEDATYSAKLYSRIEKYHFVNIHVHNWYKYGLDTTISSTQSFDNLMEKLEQVNAAWKYVPEYSRVWRLKFILESDFNLYFSCFDKYNEDEKYEFWCRLKSFIEDKKQYVNLQLYKPYGRSYVDVLLNGDYKTFKYVINETFYVDRTDNRKHNDFIAFTNYHIYVSILMALESDIPCRLFLLKGYAKYSEEFINRLKKLSVFDTVVAFDNSNAVNELFDNLEKCPDDAESVIATHLYNRFNQVFKSCNGKVDTMYIFSDSLPYWYYIQRNFDTIIKLEDAYNSFDREISSFKLYGKWAGITKYVGKEYPLIHYQSDKIKNIIISNPIEGLSDFFSRKIIVRDTKELLKKHYARFREMMLYLYDVEKEVFDSDTVLLLTQPLALFQYCTKKQQKILYKKMCSAYDKENLVIKPHPSDTLNYKYLGGTIIKKNVPIEVYNLLNIKIKKAITFGSSAIETIEFAEEKYNLFPLHGFERADVIKSIRDYIRPKKKSIFVRGINKIKREIKKTMNKN